MAGQYQFSTDNTTTINQNNYPIQYAMDVDQDSKYTYTSNVNNQRARFYLCLPSCLRIQITGVSISFHSDGNTYIQNKNIYVYGSNVGAELAIPTGTNDFDAITSFNLSDANGGVYAKSVTVSPLKDAYNKIKIEVDFVSSPVYLRTLDFNVNAYYYP